MSKSRAKNTNMFIILLMPIAIGLNFAGAQIAQTLKLPIYLDIIGTVLVGALGGPIFGGLTGALTNLTTSMVQPTELPYAIVSMAAGIVAGFLGKRNMFKTIKGTLVSGVFVWLAVLLTVTPITTLVYGGGAGVTGSNAITAFFVATGRGLWTSVISSALIVETADKFLSVFAVYFILKALPKRTILNFPLGRTYLGAEDIQVDSDDDW